MFKDHEALDVSVVNLKNDPKFFSMAINGSDVDE
jgi:hypothetical protein